MSDNRVDNGPYLRQVIDAVPAPLFVVDHDVRMRDANRAGCEFLGTEAATLVGKLCGEAVGCVNPPTYGKPCGQTPVCPDCVVRQSIRAACRRESVVRKWTRMTLQTEKGRREFCFLVSATPFESDGQPLVLVILEDVSDLTELRGLLPVCSACGKVRSSDQYWQSIQDYIRRHTPMQFSHGICPDCFLKLYGNDPALGPKPEPNAQ